MIPKLIAVRLTDVMNFGLSELEARQLLQKAKSTKIKILIKFCEMVYKMIQLKIFISLSNRVDGQISLFLSSFYFMVGYIYHKKNC